MNFIGENYHSFLNKNLKKYNYINNQDGFNMSFIPIDDKYYLFCIRLLGIIPAYFGEEIKPGNCCNTYIQTKLTKDKLETIDFGNNFFWGSWTKNLIDNSIFFVGEIKKVNGKHKIIINEKIKPYVITNSPIFLNNKISETFFYSDIRLFNYKKKILCYDGFVSGIYEIKISNNKIYTSFNITNEDFYKENILYHRTSLCNNIRNYDKNWSFVKKINKNNTEYLLFLNWFKKNKLIVTYLPYLKGINDCINEDIITMRKDVIDGLGNDKSGMFSFGVPLMEYKCDDEYCGIGLGHIKLIKTNKYNNENINKFLNQINTLKSKFKNKMIIHLSYHYLTYFFIFIKNKNKYKFFLSDAFLFLNTDKEYIFTINYAMSIHQVNDKVLVSMGLGDYYNVLLSFKLDTIKYVCKHDLENLNLNNFKYKIVNDTNLEKIDD